MNLLIPQGYVNHQIIGETFEESKSQLSSVFLFDFRHSDVYKLQSCGNIVVFQTFLSLINLCEGQWKTFLSSDLFNQVTLLGSDPAASRVKALWKSINDTFI